MDKERWTQLNYKNIKPIYEISTYGRIRNINTQHIMGESLSEKGYVMVTLMTTDTRKKSKTFKLHRLVAHTFIGSIDNNMTVNHKNGDKTKNSIYNLEIISFSDNIKHAYTEGLNIPRRGVLNGTCKHSEKIIECICALIAIGGKNREIKKYIFEKFELCVDRYLLYDLRHKKRWKHISDKYFK
jgi:hypothetical protein